MRTTLSCALSAAALRPFDSLRSLRVESEVYRWYSTRFVRSGSNPEGTRRVRLSAFPNESAGDSRPGVIPAHQPHRLAMVNSGIVQNWPARLPGNSPPLLEGTKSGNSTSNRVLRTPQKSSPHPVWWGEWSKRSITVSHFRRQRARDFKVAASPRMRDSFLARDQRLS